MNPALDLKAAGDRTPTAILAITRDDGARLERLQTSSIALLVHVRESAEYRAGHIPEAINASQPR